MAGVSSEEDRTAAGEAEAGVGEEGGKLTADEAEQYDRQIRLWGLEAQKR